MIVNKSDLCLSERRLIDLLHAVYFGRIEDLWFREGKPVFDPPPRVITTLTMHVDYCGRHNAHVRDFSLKQEVVLLLLFIRHTGSGKIRLITVKHGLPIKVDVDGLIVRAGALAE